MSDFQVEAYAGYRGDERPTTLIIGGHRHAVTEILREWQEPEGRCFRVRVGDGGEYLVQNDARTGTWREVKPRRVACD